ncbi:F-box only protein 25-like [Mizuhopecten yessoensis]|uniref:F-box only protein 25 n=1 Tax=Mizuhopecten yessoensis TaxID=6573 RepID=A0A210PEV4_MIZYE|nr:F-box only protein 25-like [Mizuhopecten yessoensis]OWF35023.1 F-box only protein 25 [Mizuhopecten yessoensis]
MDMCQTKEMYSGVESNWRRTEDGWRLLPGVFVGTGSERASASVLTRARGSRSTSKTSKTESNNTVRFVRIAGASRPHDGTSQERCDSLIPVRQPHLTGIQGIATDRRISCGLSTSIERLEITDVTLEVSGIRYCCQIFGILFEQKIGNISGTTLRLIFRVLGEVVSESLINETNISLIKGLLKKASNSLSDVSKATGSRSLWKRHRDIVSNLATQVEAFQYTQREDDDLPQLLDIPKECLHYILERLSDPRDLANVGTTCSYLHDLVTDRLLWQQMCLFHFTDKQLYPYICDDEYIGIDWFKAFQLCYQSHKRLRVVYANELCFCNRCRAVFWKNLGHPCRNPDGIPSSSPLLPMEFVDMLHL